MSVRSNDILFYSFYILLIFYIFTLLYVLFHEIVQHKMYTYFLSSFIHTDHFSSGIHVLLRYMYSCTIKVHVDDVNHWAIFSVTNDSQLFCGSMGIIGAH